MGTGWTLGLSWTKGHFERTTAPLSKRVTVLMPKYPFEIIGGNLVSDMYVHAGPFFYIPNFSGIEFYFGFRPTADWPSGFGNEGWWIFTSIAHFLKAHDVGNFGMALRRAK